MKILIISSYANPKSSTGAIRIYGLCEYLNNIDEDLDAMILTSDLSITDKHIVHFTDMTLKVQSFNKYLAVPFQVYRKLKYLLLGIKHHSLYQDCYSKIEMIHNVKNIDLIIASSPQPEILDVACLAKEKLGINFIADIRDGITFEPLRKLTRFENEFFMDLERRIVKLSSKVVTVSNPITDFFNSFENNKAITITNGYLKSDCIDELNDKLASFFPETKINILYTGRVSKSRKSLTASFNMLIDVYKSLPKEDRSSINIIFVGEFTKEEFTVIKKHFTFAGSVNRDESIAMQNKADYLLLFTGTERSVVTGKLFEYIQSGKPIISLSELGHATSIIDELGGGVHFNHTQLGYQKLLDYFLTCQKFDGLSNAKDISKYSHKYLLSEYYSLIKKVTNIK